MEKYLSVALGQHGAETQVRRFLRFQTLMTVSGPVLACGSQLRLNSCVRFQSAENAPEISA
jgi:hypothetical protein